MVRHGEPPYLECSSKGDKRFSAFYARVNKHGDTIENLYQGAKIFADGRTGLSWREAKGLKPVNGEYTRWLYSYLWDTYFEENPQLFDVVEFFNGFADTFGQVGHCCQATEIHRIVSARR
jgi:hypothetical protein